MDDDLRELERRWLASGAPDDAARFFQAAARAGGEAARRTGRLREGVSWRRFLDVAEALLEAIGDPMGAYVEEQAPLPLEPPWEAAAWERRRCDGRRLLLVERREDHHVPGGMESQDRYTRGCIEGLPGGASLRWSGDSVEGYVLEGPAPVLEALDRAFVATCERHSETRAAQEEKDAVERARRATRAARQKAARAGRRKKGSA